MVCINRYLSEVGRFSVLQIAKRARRRKCCDVVIARGGWSSYISFNFVSMFIKLYEGINHTYIHLLNESCEHIKKCDRNILCAAGESQM